MNAEEKFYRRVQTATGDSLRTLRRLGFQEISASLQDVDGSLGDRPCEMDQTPGAAPERDAECHRGFDLRLQEVAAWAIEDRAEYASPRFVDWDALDESRTVAVYR